MYFEASVPNIVKFLTLGVGALHADIWVGLNIYIQTFRDRAARAGADIVKHLTFEANVPNIVTFLTM